MTASVLVVDDDLDIAEAIGDLLELGGYSAAIALDGRSAIEQVASKTIGLVLLDWRLPDEPSGGALVDGLRQAAPQVPIVVLSADPVSLEEARATDVTGCLAKPFDNRSLLALVASYLGEVPAVR